MPDNRSSLTYGDPDLSRATGAQALIDRLEWVASQVCGTQPDIRNVGRLAAHRACAGAAMNDAVDEVSAPMVSPLYGAPLPTLASDD